MHSLNLYKKPVVKHFLLFIAFIITSLFPTMGSASSKDSTLLERANGIIAVVENEIITLENIRLEILPIIPQIQEGSRSEKEFDYQ